MSTVELEKKPGEAGNELPGRNTQHKNEIRRRQDAARLRKRKNRRNVMTRAAVQAFFFIMMPGAFVAGFSGVKNIFQHVSNGSVLEMNSFVKILIGLCLFTVIFGRYFCGYVCAFGSLGDFIYWISGLIQKKLFRRKKQIRISVKLIPWLQKMKFVILALIVITCATGIYEKLGKWNWNPWSVFSFFSALRFDLNGYVAGAVILAAIAAGMAFQERFFCQFLCPMGAVFAILPQLPFAFIRRDADNCIKGCSACRKQCPVDLKLETDGFRNGECIACERCTGACPKQNLSRWETRLIFRDELIAVIVKAGLMFAMGAYLGVVRFI